MTGRLHTAAATVARRVPRTPAARRVTAGPAAAAAGVFPSPSPLSTNNRLRPSPLAAAVHAQPHRAFATTPRRAQAEPVNQELEFPDVERVQDECDVCIVGGGPAGLSAAIQLMKMAQEKGEEIRVVVLEKGAEVGTFLRPRPPGSGCRRRLPSPVSPRRESATYPP